MQFLNDFRKHLIKSLDLDPSKVFAWVNKGSLEIAAGNKNKSFKVSYNADIAVSSFAGDLKILLYRASNYLSEHQPLFAGAKDLQFETEILKSDLHNVYLSVPMMETVIVGEVSEGTELNSIFIEDRSKAYRADDTRIIVNGEDSE